MLSFNASGFVRLGETHLGEWPSISAIAANCTGSKPPCQPSSTHRPRGTPPTPPYFQLPSCFTQRCTAFPHSVRALFIHSIFDPRFLIPTGQHSAISRLGDSAKPDRTAAGISPRSLQNVGQPAVTPRLVIDRRL